MDPVLLVKQVLQPFHFVIRHLLSIPLMGGALVMKRVVSYCQRRARYRCIFRSLHGKTCLTSCTLLKIRSALVL